MYLHVLRGWGRLHQGTHLGHGWWGHDTAPGRGLLYGIGVRQCQQGWCSFSCAQTGPAGSSVNEWRLVTANGGHFICEYGDEFGRFTVGPCGGLCDELLDLTVRPGMPSGTACARKGQW